MGCYSSINEKKTSTKIKTSENNDKNENDKNNGNKYEQCFNCLKCFYESKLNLSEVYFDKYKYDFCSNCIDVNLLKILNIKNCNSCDYNIIIDIKQEKIKLVLKFNISDIVSNYYYKCINHYKLSIIYGNKHDYEIENSVLRSKCFCDKYKNKLVSFKSNNNNNHIDNILTCNNIILNFMYGYICNDNNVDTIIDSIIYPDDISKIITCFLSNIIISKEINIINNLTKMKMDFLFMKKTVKLLMKDDYNDYVILTNIINVYHEYYYEIQTQIHNESYNRNHDEIYKFLYDDTVIQLTSLSKNDKITSQIIKNSSKISVEFLIGFKFNSVKNEIIIKYLELNMNETIIEIIQKYINYNNLEKDKLFKKVCNFFTDIKMDECLIVNILFEYPLLFTNITDIIFYFVKFDLKKNIINTVKNFDKYIDYNSNLNFEEKTKLFEILQSNDSLNYEIMIRTYGCLGYCSNFDNMIAMFKNGFRFYKNFVEHLKMFKIENKIKNEIEEIKDKDAIKIFENKNLELLEIFNDLGLLKEKHIIFYFRFYSWIKTIDQLIALLINYKYDKTLIELKKCMLKYLQVDIDQHILKYLEIHIVDLYSEHHLFSRIEDIFIVLEKYKAILFSNINNCCNCNDYVETTIFHCTNICYGCLKNILTKNIKLNYKINNICPLCSKSIQKFK